MSPNCAAFPQVVFLGSRRPSAFHAAVPSEKTLIGVGEHLLARIKEKPYLIARHGKSMTTREIDFEKLLALVRKQSMNVERLRSELTRLGAALSPSSARPSVAERIKAPELPQSTPSSEQ
jgi:hypothetical protein